MQATALIHEAYVHLIDQREKDWQNRAHFFGVAAQVMRRILVNHARTRQTAKRWGGQHKVSLDEALSRLAQFDARQSRVVELRFFGGLTEQETAEVLGVTSRTVKRDWRGKGLAYGELNKR